MIVSINQPAYLPWLGYVERIARSDVHVVLDHVQFEKNSFVNRNRVLSNSGPIWLTVPLKTKGRFGNLPICELEIDNQGPWRRKHWATLQQCYASAPHFAAHMEFFARVYEQSWKYLIDLCRHITDHLLDVLAIKTRRVYSSAYDLKSSKSAVVLDLCRACQAATYLSGALGRQYLDESIFEDAGITVTYQNYQHPCYYQACDRTFEPAMSVVDLLFNHGPNAREILLNRSHVPQDLP